MGAAGADILDMVVVADDLTGAADTAAGLVDAGFATVVAWPGEAIDGIGGVDAIALDAGSRVLDPAAAAAATTAAVAWARQRGARCLYKKCDSLLRGHIAVELDACLRAWHPDAVAIFSPAFPRAGRTTVNGRQFALGRDVGGLAEIFAAAGLSVAAIDLARVRSDRLTAALRVAAEAKIVILDAAEDDDLLRIAAAGRALDRPVVWAGTGGLIRAVARAAVDHRSVERRPAAAAPRPGPVMIVCGSASTVAGEQVDRVAAAGVHTIVVPAAALRTPDSAAVDAIAEECSIRLRDGRDVAVAIDAGPKAGDALADDRIIVQRLAAALAPCAALAGGLTATGGDTATAMLRAWRITSVRVTGEAEPGVALGVAAGDRSIAVATKAGAFGSPDALVDARNRLHEMMSQTADAR